MGWASSVKELNSIGITGLKSITQLNKSNENDRNNPTRDMVGVPPARTEK